MKVISHSLKVFLFLVLVFAGTFYLFAEQDDLNVLIEKGQHLVSQKEYPAGISVLETVLTKEPNNAKALNSLLNACDQYSQQLLAQSHFEQAQTYITKMDEALQKIAALPVIELLGNQDDSNTPSSRVQREVTSAKAFLLNPTSKQEKDSDIVSLNAGRELYNEAVQNFNKHQYEIADNLLHESIKIDSSNPYAYELLGEIANLNHKLDEAETYYRKAFSLNPSPKLREKYEKLMREKEIDKSQQQYSDEHFIIRYRRSENLEGSKIRDYLRDAYRTVSQDFGHYPKYKIPVALYDREEYQQLMGSVPHWSGALYDGKIRIPVYGASEDILDEATTANLRKLIYHELTHAFVLELSRTKCPIWLNEGLAQYEENRIKAVDLRRLTDAVQSKSLVSIDELMFEDVSKTSSQDKALLFYLESFSLTSYLINHSRFYNMKELLIELGKGTTFLDAFEKAFGRTFKDFAGEWQRDLETRQRA